MTDSSLSLLVLEGDGIGPEITAATLAVLRSLQAAFKLRFQIRDALIGLPALDRDGTTFSDQIESMARAADGVILGPVSHNIYPPRDHGGLNPSAELRKRLDLYANIRPIQTRGGVAPRCGVAFDLVIVRENTEGFYADRSMTSGPGEFMPTPDVALAMRKVTRQASLRIARRAFTLASVRKAHHVTAVHKANVLRMSDGLFLECVRSVACEFPEIRYDEQLVDAMAALLIRDPGQFDVVVTTNMFGDILSDEASELSGSLGLAPSLNAGDTHAMAQAQHGSAPDIAGKDLANPSSLISSTSMLLHWLANRRGDAHLSEAAQAIDEALEAVLADPTTRTRDCGGALGTKAFTEALIRTIGTKRSSQHRP